MNLVRARNDELRGLNSGILRTNTHLDVRPCVEPVNASVTQLPPRVHDYRNTNDGNDHDKNGDGEDPEKDEFLPPRDLNIPKYQDWGREDQEVGDNISRHVSVEGADLKPDMACQIALHLTCQQESYELISQSDSYQGYMICHQRNTGNQSLISRRSNQQK